MRAFFILVSLYLLVEQRSCALQIESREILDPRPRSLPRKAPARLSIVLGRTRLS